MRDFLNNTTKEEKHNDIYYHTECGGLLNIEQNEELIDNNNSMNYIHFKKGEKIKIKNNQFK